MLTVFTGHPDCTTLRSEHRGWSSPADPATLIAVLPHSRATGPLYISAGLLPAAVVSLETFVPELRGQVSFEHASFFSLAGSGYALRLPLLAWHNAGPRNLRCRSSLTGCRFPPPRSGGSTFSLLPQQPCRPLCPCGLFRSLRFYLPDIVRVLAPAPCRCRHWADVVTRTCDQLSLVARLRQAGYVTLVPFTVTSEGVFVTQCCNLFHSLNAALSNNAHSIVLTAATWWSSQISLHCHRPFPDPGLSAWSSVGTVLRRPLLKPNCGP